MLRCRDFGFEIVGQPLDSPYPSGQDLDDVVFGLVREQFAEQINALDPTDRAHRTALANLLHVAAFASFRARRRLQRKPDGDPKLMLWDLVRYNFLPVRR